MYQFHEGLLPRDFSHAYEETLFNKESHRFLQSQEGWHSFHILSSLDKKIWASVYFHIDEDFAKSPLRAPYGSVEFCSHVSEELLSQFIRFFESGLRNKGVKQVVVKNYPANYFDRVTSLINCFSQNNYTVSDNAINCSIEVSEIDFRNFIHRSEKKRLRRCQHANLKAMQLPESTIEKVYSFIKKCRAEKDYTISMSLDELQLAIKKFPDTYVLFGCFLDQQLISASICIRVNRSILYDFAHDHDAAFNHLSPVVKLVDEIYQYCQSNSIKILDLGTSSTEGVTKESLLNFKLRLGAKSSPKLTFQKQL